MSNGNIEMQEADIFCGSTLGAGDPNVAGIRPSGSDILPPKDSYCVYHPNAGQFLFGQFTAAGGLGYTHAIGVNDFSWEEWVFCSQSLWDAQWHALLSGFRVDPGPGSAYGVSLWAYSPNIAYPGYVTNNLEVSATWSAPTGNNVYGGSDFLNHPGGWYYIVGVADRSGNDAYYINGEYVGGVDISPHVAAAVNIRPYIAHVRRPEATNDAVAFAGGPKALHTRLMSIEEIRNNYSQGIVTWDDPNTVFAYFPEDAWFTDTHSYQANITGVGANHDQYTSWVYDSTPAAAGVDSTNSFRVNLVTNPDITMGGVAYQVEAVFPDRGPNNNTGFIGWDAATGLSVWSVRFGVVGGRRIDGGGRGT